MLAETRGEHEMRRCFNDQSTIITVNWLPSTVTIQQLDSHIGRYRGTESAHIQSTDAAAMAAFDNRLDEIRAEIKPTMAKYVSLISSPEEQALYDEFLKAFNRYMEASAELLTLSRDNKDAEATAYYVVDSLTFYNQMRVDINKLVELNVKGGADASALGDEIYAETRTLTFAALGGMILLCALIGAAVARSIAQPVSVLNGLMSKMAEGDFKVTVPYLERTEEMGSKANTLEHFRVSLVKAEEMRKEQEQAQLVQIERGKKMERLVVEFDARRRVWP